MGEYSEAFVAFDVAKKKHAVAIAEGGRTGEVRFVGEVENSPAAIERTIKKLGKKYDRLHVCFEAGPTGYGLCRQVRDLGHDCMVVAPALIPKRSGERIKTNRRDAVTLARLHRAGELTGVWVPDVVHEAVRDLVRARETAGDDLRRKRQQLLSFLLRHGRIYEGGGHWTLAHRRWLARQSFEHMAQQIAFQEKIDAIEDDRKHRKISSRGRRRCAGAGRSDGSLTGSGPAILAGAAAALGWEAGSLVCAGTFQKADTRLRRAGKLRIQAPFLSGGERPKCVDEAFRVEPKPVVHDAAIGRDHHEPGGSAGAVCLHYRRHGVC
jgi:transposase